MTWVATAIAVIGAATQQYTQHQAAKKADNQAANRIYQQAANQERADYAVNQLLTKRATDDGSAERANVTRSLMDQSQAAQMAASRGLNQGGAVSDAYRASANDAALGISDYGQRAAGLMARIDAPQQQRRREALQSGNLASQLGLIGREAASDDFLAQLRLQAIRPDPWLTAAGQIAQGIGSGMAARGGAAPKTNAGATANFGNQAGTWYQNSNLWGR
ncbi:hypothetical protein [Stenotrophomonas geniculata]|uniref:hypothetical protein n=1 Tax=Stenotrophomonas geniculata TaxID=86188 RepID=UPI000C263C70|nr:hypothetical protein [Stenotrophomonas geniculata]MDH7548270.1 hypothetical protein [Stenotrophomonas geniculata]PJL71638.1 hypothetical protein B9Y75_06640 [Stenotrophomonas maltophilia]PZT45659.1 hypothetical protein A7X92_00635 [Stenotrophomonas maltophilia]